VIDADEEDGHLTETTPFLGSALRAQKGGLTQRAHVIKALLYAFQCFYAFMMM
jgi:hypothetical protein